MCAGTAYVCGQHTYLEPDIYIFVDFPQTMCTHLATSSSADQATQTYLPVVRHAGVTMPTTAAPLLLRLGSSREADLPAPTGTIEVVRQPVSVRVPVSAVVKTGLRCVYVLVF